MPTIPPPPGSGDVSRTESASKPGGFSRLSRWVVADASSVLAQKLVGVSAFRILIVTLSLGASLAVERSVKGPAPSWLYSLIAATYAVSILYALALRMRIDERVLAYAQIAIDSVFVSALVLLTGGLDSLFTFTYVFVLIGGAITLFRPGAVLATLASLLLFAVVVVIQANGGLEFLEKLDFERAMLSFFMYAIGFGLVAFLATTLAETVRETGRELAQTETALERLEEQHEAILRSLPAGLVTVDREGRIAYANNTALRILSTDWVHIAGRSLLELVPAFVEPWRQFRNAASPEDAARRRYEGNFIRGDGQTIRLGFSFSLLSADPEQSGVIVVFQDVTDVVRLKEAVERAERLATVGKLAAGLAHEVRNPLSSMCASIEVLRDQLNPPETLEQLMKNVVREGERIDGLITDFLHFARPRELSRSREDISVLVASVTEVLRHEAKGKNIELATSLDEDCFAEVDEDRLRQVLWNFGRNAIEALSTHPKPGALLSFETRTREREVEIVIRDNGPGISEEHRKEIFDPFFTTKSRGTGLGLAIAHAIMEAHGGQVLLSTRVGEGTEFTLRIPVHETHDPSLVETDPELRVTPSHLEVLGGPL